MYLCEAMGFIWVVKNCLCYKMLNDHFENRPKCESPANENAGYYILSDTNIILRSLMAVWIPIRKKSARGRRSATA